VVKILALIILCGCASIGQVDKQVLPYVDKFEELYGQKIGPIDILIVDFDEKHKNAGGLCRLLSQQIFINKKLWETKDEYEKEMLVFHELGHCELGLAHDNQKDSKDGCYKSIMNWKSMPGKCYRKKKKYYRDELFKRERVHRWRILRLRQRRDF